MCSPFNANLDVFQQMSELFPLGLQILEVCLCCCYLDGDPFYHIYAVAFQADQLFRVVGHETHAFDSQVDENLRTDTIVAHICLEAELQVGFDRVLSLVLKGIGLELVQEADTSPFLAHVKNNSLAGGIYHLHSLVKLVSTVVSPASENIAGQAFGMDPDQYRLIPLYLTLYQSQVFHLIHIIFEGYCPEIAAVTGWQNNVCRSPDKHLVFQPVSHQVGNGADFKAMLPGKLLQLGNPGN